MANRKTQKKEQFFIQRFLKIFKLSQKRISKDLELNLLKFPQALFSNSFIFLKLHSLQSLSFKSLFLVVRIVCEPIFGVLGVIISLLKSCRGCGLKRACRLVNYKVLWHRVRGLVGSFVLVANVQSGDLVGSKLVKSFIAVKAGTQSVARILEQISRLCDFLLSLSLTQLTLTLLHCFKLFYHFAIFFLMLHCFALRLFTCASQF